MKLYHKNSKRASKFADSLCSEIENISLNKNNGYMKNRGSQMQCNLTQLFNQ